MTNLRHRLAEVFLDKFKSQKWALLLIGLALFPGEAETASPRPRTASVSEFQQCMDEVGYTTAGDLHCLADAQIRADILLDLAYRKALAQLSQDKRAALKLSQNKWLKKIVIDCDNDPKVKENEGGSLAHVSYNECYLAKTKDRTKWIRLTYPHKNR